MLSNFLIYGETQEKDILQGYFNIHILDQSLKQKKITFNIITVCWTQHWRESNYPFIYKILGEKKKSIQRVFLDLGHKYPCNTGYSNSNDHNCPSRAVHAWKNQVKSYEVMTNTMTACFWIKAASL